MVVYRIGCVEQGQARYGHGISQTNSENVGSAVADQQGGRARAGDGQVLADVDATRGQRNGAGEAAESNGITRCGIENGLPEGAGTAVEEIRHDQGGRESSAGRQQQQAQACQNNSYY